MRQTNPFIHHLSPLAAGRMLLLFGALVLSSLTVLRAEGVQQVAPSAEDLVMLLIGDANYGNFANNGSVESSRLYVQLTDVNETLYLGLSREYSEDGSPGGTGSYSFRIKRASDDAIVHGPYSMNSFVENISSWEDASGPAVLNNGIGYDTEDERFTFTPEEGGLYYIEFISASYIGLWDFTVGANGVEVPGRVFSKNWSFRTPTISNSSPECVWDREFNGGLYSYTDDGFVTRIDFANSGFQGLSFAMAFNTRGPGDSGDIGLDRMSIPNENATSEIAEHLIFLEEPDPTLFPDGDCGEVSSAPFFECTGPGSYCLDVTVTQSGQVEIIIDVNQNNVFDPEIDRRLLYRFLDDQPLTTCVPWDGRLADGTPIDPGANLNLLIQYTQGVQHWTLFDGEFLKEGFCVEPIRPICNDNGLTNILYWDDRNIEEDPGNGQPKDGRAGCSCEDDDCRTWDYFDPNLADCSDIDDTVTLGYGDKSSLNTWWFANVVNSNLANVPLISLELDGVAELCTGTTEELSFTFYSTAELANITWEGPNGIIATGPDAPLAISIVQGGTYTINIEDASGCTYSDTQVITETICPTDLAVDITASTTVPEVGNTVTFTITVTNEGDYDASNFSILADWLTGLTNPLAMTAGANVGVTSLNWINESLAVGQSTELIFTAVITPAFEYIVSAQVQTHLQGDIDSTPGNGVDTNNNGQCVDDSGDEDDGDCVQLFPPACNISATVSNRVCDPNDTFEDPNDDTFTFSITINGSNGGNGWSGQIGGQAYAGNYGETLNLGPFLISEGTFDYNFNDNFFSSSCTSSGTITPPIACSDNCVINIETEETICNNNGTPFDPSDDTYSFRFRLSGANTGASWWASNGSTGNYDTWYTSEGHSISTGNLTLSFIDIADGNCSVSNTFIAPPTCSDDCLLAAIAGTPVCNDNGTPSDPLDDTFTFSLTVNGVNTSNNWTANDPLASSGSYGPSRIMGPYPISGGNLSFIVADSEDASCTALIDVTAPSTCSDLCVLEIEQLVIECQDNGTITDGSDDTYTVQVRLTGANISNSWLASDDRTGTYDEVVTMGPYLISSGNQTVTFTDSDDANCTSTTTFIAPPSCSTTCVIEAVTSAAICNDAGTPSDPSDDTFTFTLTVTGANTAMNWTANDPSNASSSYGIARMMGPYPISGGDLNFTISDAGDASCITIVNVAAPATCSDLCVLTLEETTPLCQDNGTISEGSDDTYIVEVRLTGDNTSENWLASDGTTGLYGDWVTMGPYLISDGDQNITFTDSADGSCVESTTFVAPFNCSNTCVIEAVTSTAICSDAGTPSDPSDDTFTFTLTVMGANTAMNWTANDPNNASSSYGIARMMGPYPISGGDLNFTVSDAENAGCTTMVNVVAPATCSDLCVLTLEQTTPLCQDNGTVSDGSDDTYIVDVRLTGDNIGSSWLASDGTTGLYGDWVTMGPYLISEGNQNITFTDATNNTCEESTILVAPASCSTTCAITAVAGDAICDDAGTPSDPSDDTFSFTLTVTGTNVSNNWVVNSPTVTMGSYGVSRVMGPYPISGGNLNLSILDGNNVNCNTQISIVAPETCSDLCVIEATLGGGVASCDSNGTLSDDSDDTFSFQLSVSGANTSSNWITTNGQSGAYNELVDFGPYLIADGPVTIEFTDTADGSCSTAITIDPPATCSDLCLLEEAILTAVLCDDNGTSTDPSDDTYSFAVTLNGFNLSSSWLASDGATGAYGQPINFGPYSIADGDISLVFTDAVATDCNTEVMVMAPATCSDECAITATTSNYQCYDNDTPADSSDDLFTFDLQVESINNTGSSWIQPSGNAGTYGQVYTQGPFAISEGTFDLVVQDVNDSNCTASVEIVPTETCSDDCILMVNLLEVVCDDQGTDEDSSDDVFFYTISVDAINATGVWTASDGTTGAFGEIVTSIAHDFSEGSIEITISEETEKCPTTFTITPPSPGLMCPEDTDQRRFVGSVQLIEASLNEEDDTVSDPPCFLASSSVPMTFGDRYMQAIDILTPEQTDTTENVYSFFLFSNIHMPMELEEHGQGDGAGMLFRGDYYGYMDPCCFSQSYMPTVLSTDDYEISDPYVDTTGFFDEDMFLVQRFTQTLKVGQRFSLVTTTYGAENTGDFSWVIVSEVDEPLTVISETASTEFFPNQELSEDLTHLMLNWAQDNVLSVNNLGDATIIPYCGVDSLYFLDALDYGDSCTTAVIERSFVLESGGQADTCAQLLSFRRPLFEDIVLPPATVTFNCGDDYDETLEGFPSPQNTGYPLLDTGEDYIEMINEDVYFNLAASYKDIPNFDTTDLLVDLVREWTITDACTGDTLYVIPQLIKVGEFDLPTIICPQSTNPCTCPEHADIMLFDVDPFGCTATVDIPYPELRGFCDESRAEDWAITTNIIHQETEEIVATILDEESRSVTSVERGDYWLEYMAEDELGNLVTQRCPMRVADLQHPNAICRSSLTVELAIDETDQMISTAQLDLGSFDNCDFTSLLVRRFYYDDMSPCTNEPGGGYGEWEEETPYYCCDADRNFTVELQVMDADSNTNYCIVQINVVDETIPELSGLNDRVLSCADLPASFDPTDSLALASLFGMPEVLDNCLAEVVEMEPELSWNNCDLGSIRRRFHATDFAGNTNLDAYEQNITINAENRYGIRFPKDLETDCIEGLADLQIDAVGCGDFLITYTDEDVIIDGISCPEIRRTYSIINSCTYDGISDPMVISRNENCNTGEGTEDIWLVIRDGSAFLDVDNDPANQMPPANNCATNPMGFWRSLTNVGAWEYTQIIRLNDNVAPLVDVAEVTPFCTIDSSCEGPVNISMTLTENCRPEQTKISLFLDTDDDGSVDENLTNAGIVQGEWPNYRIEGNFPVGSHAFVLEVEDACRNMTSERIPFMVADCYIEQPTCLTNIQVQLEPNVPATDLNGDGILDEGAIVLSADLLAEALSLDCSGDYGYAVQQEGLVTDFANTNLILTCEDRYSTTRVVTVYDNAFNPYAMQPDGTMGGSNYASCSVQISIQDSLNVCSSCVENELEIEGVIRKENGEEINGVAVQIFVDDELSEQEFTVDGGKYDFPSLSFSTNYKVTPYKNDDVRNGVTTLDLIILQRHLLLLSEITNPYELLAADINADGQVTTLDLIFLRALLLEDIELFPNNTSWRFVPVGFSLTDIGAEIPDSYVYFNLVVCQFGQDFIGVKIGDLNGSVSAEGQLVEEDNTGRSTWPIYTSEQAMKVGESYRIPIIAGQVEELSGLELSLQIATDKLEILEIEPGLITAGQISTTALNRGILKAIWVADQQLHRGDQTLFTLIVKATDNVPLASTISLQEQLLSKAYDQALLPHDFSLAYLERAQEIMLLPNKPDPFHSFTNLDFFLPEAGTYRLELTDVTGRVLQQFQEDAPKGYHQLVIDGNTLPKGIIYYTLNFNGKQLSRRMLKL